MKKQHEIKCLYCKKIFHHVFFGKSDKRLFCTQDCFRKYVKEMRESEKILIICKTCSKELLVPPYEAKRIFCSNMCHSNFRHGKTEK